MQELDRRTIALIALRARLKLELKIKEFAQSRSGRATMKAVKGWLGPKVRTRTEALELIELELEIGEKS